MTMKKKDKKKNNWGNLNRAEKIESNLENYIDKKKEKDSIFYEAGAA